MPFSSFKVHARRKDNFGVADGPGLVQRSHLKWSPIHPSLATPRIRAYTLGLLQNSAPKLASRAGGLPMVVLCHRQPNRVFRLRTPQGFT